MKFPTVFVNHGGGPLPLLGRQPDLVKHMKEVRSKWLPTQKPDAIVVFSAHWESNVVRIASSLKPTMLYDYYGFPSETYKYEYNAPGSPSLANKIKHLLDDAAIENELDNERGFDHGVFIPLMLIYPEADIPVVSVSMHQSLSAKLHIEIGRALESLRYDNILMMGSGYTFHNLPAFFNPTEKTYKASQQFNNWLVNTMTCNNNNETMLEKLKDWDKVPGARICHPREEHLIPLFMTAASAGNDTKVKVIYETKSGNGDHAVSSYLFE